MGDSEGGSMGGHVQWEEQRVQVVEQGAPEIKTRGEEGGERGRERESKERMYVSVRRPICTGKST
jgi:hypothetical protein